MPYVERAGGAIVAVFHRPQPGRAEAYLDDSHPDIAAFNAMPPQPLRKALIIERMTDGEIDAARTARSAMSARDNEVWDAATLIEPGDPRLTGFFTTLFGATRTAELLAAE